MPSWVDERAIEPDLRLWTSGTFGLSAERQLPRGLPPVQPVQSSLLLDSANSLGSAVRLNSMKRWFPTAPESEQREMSVHHAHSPECAVISALKAVTSQCNIAPTLWAVVIICSLGSTPAPIIRPSCELRMHNNITIIRAASAITDAVPAGPAGDRTNCTTQQSISQPAQCSGWPFPLFAVHREPISREYVRGGGAQIPWPPSP